VPAQTAGVDSPGAGAVGARTGGTTDGAGVGADGGGSGAITELRTPDSVNLGPVLLYEVPRKREHGERDGEGSVCPAAIDSDPLPTPVASTPSALPPLHVPPSLSASRGASGGGVSEYNCDCKCTRVLSICDCVCVCVECAVNKIHQLAACLLCS
jgi:hypothetical protein